MTPEANSPVNCKSSVSIPRERAFQSIYFEPSGFREREGENDPEIGTEDRIAAINSRSSREYVQGILFISRAELKSSSWRLLARSHLVIFIGGSFSCERVFTNISALHVFLAGLDVSARLGYAKRNCESRQRK